MRDAARELRWTAMAGEYPVAHHEALFMAERIAKERGYQPTHFILRERAYPFKTVKTVLSSASNARLARIKSRDDADWSDDDDA